MPQLDPVPNAPLEKEKRQAATWFHALRDTICQAFQGIEEAFAQEKVGTPGTFVRKTWQRPGGGGGTMAKMHGQVFEKVGVNVSEVHGVFSESLRHKIPGALEDPQFWASGISLVAHMVSPLIPAVHMNTRMIVTKKHWFGGGMDLTPTVPDPLDTKHFHDVLKNTCDAHDPAYYPQYKAWCDDYFYLKHRQEPRGVGGIFYDTLDTGSWEKDFSFTQDVGRAFLDAFLPIVKKHLFSPWSPQQKEAQLIKRGRYVEFNLLYDRGTLFGFETGGNTEAILMSMPPSVKWP